MPALLSQFPSFGDGGNRVANTKDGSRLRKRELAELGLTSGRLLELIVRFRFARRLSHKPPASSLDRF